LTNPQPVIRDWDKNNRISKERPSKKTKVQLKKHKKIELT
jgi:hypothetical protein